ncbi:MAG: helix-hairpin-helix domain-containing protein [Phycisphaerae bacterium]|jgi:competence ComEA-like helix-hairpin-helix protein
MQDSGSQRRDAQFEKTEGLSYILACVFMLAAAAMFSFDVIVRADGDKIELQTRVNPNDAPMESLLRLPRVGIPTAEKIIAYRENFGGPGPVFKNADDLQNIKGIGPKTVVILEKYLYFYEHH